MSSGKSPMAFERQDDDDDDDGDDKFKAMLARRGGDSMALNWYGDVLDNWEQFVIRNVQKAVEELSSFDKPEDAVILQCANEHIDQEFRENWPSQALYFARFGWQGWLTYEHPVFKSFHSKHPEFFSTPQARYDFVDDQVQTWHENAVNKKTPLLGAIEQVRDAVLVQWIRGCLRLMKNLQNHADQDNQESFGPAAPAVGGSVTSATPTCVVPGCMRPPWNRVEGEPCCRTCVHSGGHQHGRDCKSMALVRQLSAESDDVGDEGAASASAGGAFKRRR